MSKMETTKTIKLALNNIVITLIDPDKNIEGAWQGGSMESDIKETCPYCNDIDCEMNCEKFEEHCTDRDIDCFNKKKEERVEFMTHRGAAEAIESLILSHAVAGIDVESPAYIEGIETSLNAVTNNL